MTLNPQEHCADTRKSDATAPTVIPDSISRHSTDQFLCCNDVHAAIAVRAKNEEREQNAKIIRELRNALIVSANNAYERKSIVNEIKPERMFYNELQFQSLVESALKMSDSFKVDYELREPLKWRRDADNESRTEKKPKRRT